MRGDICGGMYLSGCPLVTPFFFLCMGGGGISKSKGVGWGKCFPFMCVSGHWFSYTCVS